MVGKPQQQQQTNAGRIMGGSDGMYIYTNVHTYIHTHIRVRVCACVGQGPRMHVFLQREREALKKTFVEFQLNFDAKLDAKLKVTI